MEFQHVIDSRRSVRKFAPRPVPQEVIDRLIRNTLTAPSSRNCRSTRLLVIKDEEQVHRLAEMRDYGSGFLKGAPLAIIVMGDTSKSDMWSVNAAISATLLQLSCIDAGLQSCWVQIDGRPRLKSAPEGEQATDFLRTFLPIPDTCQPLCAIAIGYSDFHPAALPPLDPNEVVTIVEPTQGA